jgi:hypothetical protein
MTPSQLSNNATRDDIVMLAAYFEILNDQMPKIDAPAPSPARRSRRR